jgi:hypothetical protein
MRALSNRKPYAELILREIKTVEYRTRPTRIIGERFYIYASKAKVARPIWSDDLRVATPPKWMLELAEQVGMIEPGALRPIGVIVGSADVWIGSARFPTKSSKFCHGGGKRKPPSR